MQKLFLSISIILLITATFSYGASSSSTSIILVDDTYGDGTAWQTLLKEIPSHGHVTTGPSQHVLSSGSSATIMTVDVNTRKRTACEEKENQSTDLKHQRTLEAAKKSDFRHLLNKFAQTNNTLDLLKVANAATKKAYLTPGLQQFKASDIFKGFLQRRIAKKDEDALFLLIHQRFIDIASTEYQTIRKDLLSSILTKDGESFTVFPNMLYRYSKKLNAEHIDADEEGVPTKIEISSQMFTCLYTQMNRLYQQELFYKLSGLSREETHKRIDASLATLPVDKMLPSELAALPELFNAAENLNITQQLLDLIAILTIRGTFATNGDFSALAELTSDYAKKALARIFYLMNHGNENEDIIPEAFKRENLSDTTTFKVSTQNLDDWKRKTMPLSIRFPIDEDYTVMSKPAWRI